MLNKNLTKFIDSKAEKVNNEIKAAQNVVQQQTQQLSKQINETNQTMKVAAPILKAMGHSEAVQVAKGLDLAQKNLVPVLDQSNKMIQKGAEITNQTIQKASNLASQQIGKINETVSQQLDQGQQIAKQQFEKSMTAIKENQGLQNIVAKASVAGAVINQILETPTEDGSGIQQIKETQTKNQQQMSQSQHQNQAQQEKKMETPDNGRLSIAKNENYHFIQTKIKSYIKKITGKQVNSRIEYLCLLQQKLKDSNDINYMQKAKATLKNEMWKGAYQDRRIQSHQIFVQYMGKMIEFIFEYLSIVETVFQQIKMRYKSSNNSFEMLLNYCNGISIQLDYYLTYGYIQQNQSLLGRLFTNQAKSTQVKKNGKKEKQQPNQNTNETPTPQQTNAQPENVQYFHQTLCQNFSALETEYLNQAKSIQILKQILKNEIREQLIICQQMNQQKISDYLMQLQGQRNITFDAIEQFYKSFISYENLYDLNVQAAFDGASSTKDLYDEEYKMYYYFRCLIKQQQLFGLFTTYMLKEISQFELYRIETVQKIFIQLNDELIKYFTYPKIGLIDFRNQLIIEEAKTAFDINQLLNPEQLDIIKKYAAVPFDKRISTDIYASFASNFQIPTPETLLTQSPLLLKRFSVQRDVAWERSLSFGKDFVPTQFLITVDGFLLFYDSDWKDLNCDEPIQCHNQMAIVELIIKESKSDETVLQLKVKKSGKFFDTHKKQILKMNDPYEKESLILLLNQFK